MAAWLIILGDKQGLAWVLENKRMAFRRGVRTPGLKPGDDVMLYVTRGAYGNAPSAESQLLAMGRVASEVRDEELTIGDQEFDRVCDLELEVVLTPKHGVAFRPLVPKLGFIRKKDSWAVYLRRTVVPIEPADFRVMATALRRHAEDR